MNMLETLQNLLNDSGFVSFFADGGWKNLVMIAVSCLLLYLGIKKQFEPLLLVGIAFGCLLVNVSNFFVDGASSSNALYHPELWNAFLEEGGEYYHSYGHIMANGGLLDILYIGVKSGLYPSLIFLGIGAMTDFGPLLSSPKNLLLVQLHRWVFSWRSLVRFAWALTAIRQHPSVSSAVQTARQRSS